MADNPSSPFPPSKSGVNPRSLANLRPCKKGDPSPNKTGANGRTRGEKVAAFLDEVDDTTLGKSLQAKIGCPGVSRIQAVLHREWLAAMGKSDLARKGLREAYAGRPHQAVDVTSSDRSMSPNRKPTTAEARQELDAILSALDERAPAAAGAAASETVEETEGAATAAPVEVTPETGGAAEMPEVAAEADTEPKAGP
jgi:hypothetical protein